MASTEFDKRLEANIRESLRFAVGQVDEEAVAHMVAGVNAVLNHPSASAPSSHMTGDNTLLARVASIICEETCGLTSECKSREAAKALLDKGYLQSADEIEQLRDRAETAVTAANALQVEVDRIRASRHALELAEGRLALLLQNYPDESDTCDHPGATRYVLEVVREALASTPPPETKMRGSK